VLRERRYGRLMYSVYMGRGNRLGGGGGLSFGNLFSRMYSKHTQPYNFFLQLHRAYWYCHSCTVHNGTIYVFYLPNDAQ
jgi:hypothetical protein